MVAQSKTFDKSKLWHKTLRNSKKPQSLYNEEQQKRDYNQDNQ